MAYTALQARTYTLESGKWSDLYADSCIDADVEVIVAGTVILDMPIIIEGTLTIEDQAMLMGLERISITETGRLCNEGVIMANCLYNKGTIQSKHALSVIDKVSNIGTIDNGDLMVAGKSIDIGQNAITNGKGNYMTNDLILEPNTEIPQTKIRYAGQLTKVEEDYSADPSKWEDGEKAPTSPLIPPK